MSTDLRTMLFRQLITDEGKFYHLDYWDIFNLDSPASEEEIADAQKMMNNIDCSLDGEYCLQLSGRRDHFIALFINMSRLTSSDIPSEQFFEKNP